LDEEQRKWLLKEKGFAESENSRQRGWSVLHSLEGYDLYIVHMQQVWQPPTDVYETDEHVVIKVEIAGMEEEDFDISLVDHELAVAGHRRDPASKLGYQNMEIHYGEFRTAIRINWALDESAIDATYEKGFLFLKLSKPKEHRVRVHVRPTADEH